MLDPGPGNCRFLGELVVDWAGVRKESRTLKVHSNQTTGQPTFGADDCSLTQFCALIRDVLLSTVADCGPLQSIMPRSHRRLGDKVKVPLPL